MRPTKSLLVLSMLCLMLLIQKDVDADLITAKQYEDLMKSEAGQQVLETYIIGVGHGVQVANVMALMQKGSKLWCTPHEKTEKPITSADYLDWTKAAFNRIKTNRPHDYGQFPIAQLFVLEIAKKFPCN